MPLVFRKQPSGGSSVSGGRGEYELVGEDAGINARDLREHGFIWKTPFGLKESEVILSHQGGKWRLRLTRSGGSAIHVQRQAAAMALLPRSHRDERAVSHGRPIVLEDRYILDIGVALEAVAGGMATVEPVNFVARSGPVSDLDHQLTIAAAGRFARIDALWAAATRLPPIVMEAVEEHRATLRRPVIDRQAEKAVEGVLGALAVVDLPLYIPGADPLPALEFLAGIEPTVDLPDPTEAPEALPEIRIRLEKAFRLQRVRGASHERFKKAVQTAYRFRCAFCGESALDIPGKARAGVDAAHILPWGQFDLDVVQNGLMLCKRDHWAFDEHVLLLRHATGNYSVDLNPEYAMQISDPDTLSLLIRAVGPISEDRLPTKSKRPSPEYIAKLYEGLNV